MKTKILVVAIISVALLANASAQEIEVKSKVDKVVLLQTSAEITRSTKTQLPLGRSKIIFSGIPQNLNPDSLRVSGSGLMGISIAGVEQQTRHLIQDVSKEAADLEKKIQQLKRDLSGIELQKARLTAQKNLLQSVALDKPSPTEQKDVLRPRTSQEMGQVLGFVAEASAKIDNEAKLADEKKEDIDTELEKLQAELSEVETGGKEESVVEVSLNADKAGEANLSLTYQVSGASWRPAYNFNFENLGKEPEYRLETYALASQSTGEDWDNVELSFSTAQSHLGLNRPIVAARILDIFKVQAMPASVGMMRAQSMAKSSARAFGGASEEADDMELKENVLADAPIPKQATDQLAEISTLGVVTYKVPARLTIKSGGAVEKLKLTEAKLKGAVRNIAIPTMSTLVYREAKLENTMDAPLLPGQVAVFSNGNYVGKQYVPYTQQNKELLLSVGVSDDISVTRKQVKKFEDDSGVVRSIRRIQTGYEIEVENHGSQAAVVNIVEPSPVSRNDEIKVALTKVVPAALDAKDDKRVQKDEGVLEWQVALEPKKKGKVEYESSVEFASGTNVTGIEGL